MQKYVAWIGLLLLPFLFSCEMKKDLLGGIDDNMDSELSGDVGLLDLELVAEKEAEVSDTKLPDLTGSTLEADSFTVSVYSSDGSLVKTYPNYEEMKEEGGVLLAPGVYTMLAEWGENVKAAFDKPYYAGRDTFEIVTQEVLKVQTICTLDNKKVTFRYSDNFTANFGSDFVIVLDNGLGVLSLDKNESRSAYLQNTGTLRFTVYATNRQGDQLVYNYDMSKNEDINQHNNILIDLDITDSKPDEGEPEEPEEPVDPDEPEDPGDTKPDLPVDRPFITVDISLIEKDFVIEIPSDIIEGGNNENPDQGSDDDGNDDETPVDPSQQSPTITGTIDGKSFNVGTAQTISSSTKSVVINLYLPTGLASLDVGVNIGSFISLQLDLLDQTSVNEINDLLSGMGKKLEVPSKGDKGNLKFDISPFLEMLDTTNSFVVQIKDNNGKSASATIKLNKK